ncbi:MAG: TVP38/TMEM64 family protein [Eggerthellaceae bacterium]
MGEKRREDGFHPFKMENRERKESSPENGRKSVSGSSRKSGVSDRPALARLTKADLFKFGGLIAFFVLMAVVCVAIAPLILELTEPGGVERVVQDVRNAGPGGVLILLGMQFLQVVVAFIPGEVVQVAAGMMYGPWGGAAVVLVGCVISSAFVFFIVHKLGAPFVRAMIPEKWMGKLEDFEETDKLDVMVFVLFLIPDFPKTSSPTWSSDGYEHEKLPCPFDRRSYPAF